MALKEKNPMKFYAMMLAHQMDDEKRINWEALPPWKIEEIRECGTQLRDEIWRKGLEIGSLVAYAEEYKTLTMPQYAEWIKQ
jgi:hypothetical protein